MWPNIDAGSDVFSKQIRILKEEKNNSIRFVRNFNPEDYLIVLKNCKMIIGNSSSGIREGSFLGIPSINIGSRQRNRERGPNVIDVNYNSNNILRAIFKQLNKKYKSSKIYGDGSAGKRISNIIGKVDLKLKDKLNYIKN
jgi:UDP-N-acetylglucosamine 2-epimerase